MTLETLADLSACLQNGDDSGVRELTRSALASGVPPSQILDQGLLPGMAVVGTRFRYHELFLPDVLLAARAMHAGMAVLKPLLRDDGPRIGRIVIGTVSGDLHDIGKNLVGILLEGAGFDIIDLGTDVPPERFVDAAVDARAPVIGLSALLTTTMVGMKDVVDLVRARDLTRQVKTIVGGAPVTAAFAREIGANAYAFDAASAVERVQSLVRSIG